METPAHLVETLATFNLSTEETKYLINILEKNQTPAVCWQEISRVLVKNNYSFALHLAIFEHIFPHWHDEPDTAAAWLPDEAIIKTSNIFQYMQKNGFESVQEFHQFSCREYETFWRDIIKVLAIPFTVSPNKIINISNGIEHPIWFPNIQLNIAAACFKADANATAIKYLNHHNELITISYAELNHLSNQVANSLQAKGFNIGDAIAIAMPMNYFAVAIYLGIIKMGGVVVSIADSFSKEEIATRLQIANTQAIFTQDKTIWCGKEIPLYPKIKQSTNIPIVVLPCNENADIEINDTDFHWHDFLLDDNDFTPIAMDAMAPCNILFSSGTTSAPKAIIWNHTTPIRAATDAYFHQNIQAGDVLTWPTNLGWMMGPWLIYAALINNACIALYTEAPKDKAFGEFITRTDTTMLGLVPTLIANWRQTKCMEGLDWQKIKVFSSSGECSNPEDMLYLMSLAGYKPIIEYCGGTEIGGAYLSSTVIQANYPSLFSTPTMGLHFAILDETGHENSIGEVALIPPAIGLSTQLLNADHNKIYYHNMPKLNAVTLRRHGDQIKHYTNGYYAVLGRNDDTMNLSGIKISSAEIERAIAGIANIIETAAIGITPPNLGPTQLIIFVCTEQQQDKKILKSEMQKRINLHLNPLFKIHDIVIVKELPKTASNKIMRRILRDKY